MAILEEISEYLQKGRAKVVKELVQQALDEGIPAEKILNEGLVAYLKGDFEKANLLVQKAQEQGLAEANQQMEEFNKK